MSTNARLRLAAVALLASAGVVFVSTSAHAEDAESIDFTDGYTLGQDYPAGQNGWKGYVMQHFDWALVANASYGSAGFGTDGVSLRFSNWIGNTNQWANINQLISPTIEPAGDPSTGAVNNTFETTFTIASATGGYQERLAASVAVDNGSGSRSGGSIGFMHTPDGLQLITAGINLVATGIETDWTTQFSGYYDETVPHQIRIVSEYITDGADQISVYVDGSSTPALVGNTYEGYHDAASSTDAQKQSSALLFRAIRSEPGVPGSSVVGFAVSSTPTSPQLAALKDQGFLFADISYRTYNTIPENPPALPPTPPTPSTGTELDLDKTDITPTSSVTVTATGMLPGELVGFTAYSTPVFLGYQVADAGGIATLSFTPPASLAAGSHTIVATGVTSSRIASSAFTLRALAATGSEPAPVLALGVAALALGAGVVLLGARRRATRAAS